MRRLRMTLARVVVGTDGSPGAAQALAWVEKLARHSETEVVVVHATAPGDVRRATIADLDAWCASLRASGIVYRCTLIENSDPRIALPALSEEEDADLIVVGSRGRNLVTEIMVGSVGQYLVHHSPRPVAVVRGETAATSDAVEDSPPGATAVS
jgi:nucleotide-binding universal stress UspA family protein